VDLGDELDEEIGDTDEDLDLNLSHGDWSCVGTREMIPLQ